jgi:UDP-GlcNAc3NAcA epimerase
LKIATIVGARPQFIKAATVSRAIRRRPELREVLIHTGQHYDMNMSDIFFQELELREPDYHLGIGDLPHGAMTGRMLERAEEVLVKEQPDWVLVYGDTNSTLAGALATAKLHLRGAHVEAGLRSFNRRMPEEVNRTVADHVADVLFAPTDIAVANLRNEGVPEDRIHQVGDVMLDAALFSADKAARVSQILDHLNLQPKGYALATVHREENTDDPHRLAGIFEGLDLVAAPQSPIVLALHPRTRKRLTQFGLSTKASNRVRLIEPVGYLDMAMLTKNAKIVFTDSGGLQKEAFFYRVPCVTLREETEWTELVDHRFNILSGTSQKMIAAASDEFRQRQLDWDIALYGDGKAADKIVDILMQIT